MESGEAAAVTNDDALLFGLVGKSKDPTAYDFVGKYVSVGLASCTARMILRLKLMDARSQACSAMGRSGRSMPSGSRWRVQAADEPVHERKPQAAEQIRRTVGNSAGGGVLRSGRPL